MHSTYFKQKVEPNSMPSQPQFSPFNSPAKVLLQQTPAAPFTPSRFDNIEFKMPLPISSAASTAAAAATTTTTTTPVIANNNNNNDMSDDSDQDSGEENVNNAANANGNNNNNNSSNKSDRLSGTTQSTAAGTDKQRKKRKNFTEDEDLRILRGIEKYGTNHWEQIVAEFELDRTPAQLRTRYTKSLRAKAEKQQGIRAYFTTATNVPTAGSSATTTTSTTIVATDEPPLKKAKSSSNATTPLQAIETEFK
jgi:hypothetical protein